MKRFVRTYSIALFFTLLSSCSYSYSAVRVYGKIKLDRGPANSEISVLDSAAAKASQVKQIRRFYTIKYFAKARSKTALAKINNRAVSLALKGRFRESEILLNQVFEEDKNFAPACNNLGIIYEIAGDRDRAFSMYTRACVLEQENEVFRNNFLSYQDTKQ